MLRLRPPSAARRDERGRALALAGLLGLACGGDPLHVGALASAPAARPIELAEARVDRPREPRRRPSAERPAPASEPPPPATPTASAAPAPIADRGVAIDMPEETGTLTCDRRCVGGDQDGDDLLTPIDRDHGLRPGWEPGDLVALGPPYVIAEGSPPNLLRREAAAAFVALSDAAFAATGVRINIRSGYRPFALQCGIFRAEAAKTGCEEATRSSARAGFSEHQLGTTADLAVGWRRLSGAAPIDAYLDAHAHELGWVLSYPDGAEGETGYKHEPWHYRYLGPTAARDLVARSDAARRLSTQAYLGDARPSAAVDRDRRRSAAADDRSIAAPTRSP